MKLVYEIYHDAIPNDLTDEQLEKHKQKILKQVSSLIDLKHEDIKKSRDPKPDKEPKSKRKGKAGK